MGKGKTAIFLWRNSNADLVQILKENKATLELIVKNHRTESLLLGITIAIAKQAISKAESEDLSENIETQNIKDIVGDKTD